MMWRLLYGFALAGLLAVASSAGAAGSYDEADARVVACFAAMDRMPALAVVNAKFARRDPSPAQLADARFADAEEAEALRLRVTATRPCRELRLAAIRAHRPLLEGAYAILYYQADQVFDVLIGGRVAYGTANRLAQASFAAFKAREQAYDAAGSDDERRALAQEWRAALEQARAAAPGLPPAGAACEWRGLNVACE